MFQTFDSASTTNADSDEINRNQHPSSKLVLDVGYLCVPCNQRNLGWQLNWSLNRSNVSNECIDRCDVPMWRRMSGCTWRDRSRCSCVTTKRSVCARILRMHHRASQLASVRRCGWHRVQTFGWRRRSMAMRERKQGGMRSVLSLRMISADRLHEGREMDKRNRSYQWNPSKVEWKTSRNLEDGCCLPARD